MEDRRWSEKIDDCVKAYRNVFSGYEIEIPSKGLLAGFHKPVFKFDFEKNSEVWTLFHADNLHYPMGDAYLKYGISGIIKMTEAYLIEEQEENTAYWKGIHDVYKEIWTFIARHAKRAKQLSNQADSIKEKERLSRIAVICENLTAGKPESFLEALQLFWFLYLLRSPFGSGCIGRLDQKLYPFYRRDVEKGIWNRREALSVIIQFYDKLNRMSTGDTLRNLMLSGQNSEGGDETNELTFLFLEAYEKTQRAEPHLNVRFHKNTPRRLKETCIRMLATGKGQPTVYFDENIMPAMESAGISHEDACNYTNDGCTETVYEGKSSIDFWQHEMVKTVELTMFNGEENPFIYPVKMKKNREKSPFFEPHTQLKTGFRSGELSKMHCFPDFMSAFFAQLEYQIACWIEIIEQKIEADEKDTLTSPLVGGTLEKCIQTGKDPLRGGGFDVENYQLLSGTVTTAADSLRALEYCVFERGYCTLEEIRDAMALDFEGCEPLRQRLLHAPKYGSGDVRVNELAAQISEKFLEQVNAYRSKSGKKIRPGLYNIDFKIFANITGATPDGRKFRDPIGEHCSPTPGMAKCGPTAIVESAAFLPMRKGYASSVLQLTLDGSGFVMGADREKIIGQLLEALRMAGVPVCSLTMYQRDELLEAKKNPEKHMDLIVRVWGFNARFVDLDEEMQNHIISRIC